MRAIATLTVAILTMAYSSDHAWGDALPTPEADTVLSVSGGITHTNVDGRAEFDLEMLAALPQMTIETSTIWNTGTHMFRGPLLKDVLEQVGASGTSARAAAINDYAVEIPLDSLTDEAPIVAYLMNGDPMHRREKGPLWVIYPYDSGPEFQTETIYTRSIWQLDRIEITQ